MSIILREKNPSLRFQIWLRHKTQSCRTKGLKFHALRLYEPRCEKTSLRGFRPGPTQTRLYSYRRWLETGNFEFRKKRDCTIHVAKTKALISFALTTKLICVFVFAYAKSPFSHNVAHLSHKHESAYDLGVIILCSYWLS